MARLRSSKQMRETAGPTKAKRARKRKPARPVKCRMDKDKLTLRFVDTIPSTFEALEKVIDELIELAHEVKCNSEHLEHVELALREALVNAIVHGNRQDPQKRVTVRCFCQPGRGMLLAVEDEGLGFDPSCVPDPRNAECLLETHGRGLFLMRHLVDYVRISRSGRRVTLVKRLRP
jgi:serine/threonine-protein kinase RsbW